MFDEKLLTDFLYNGSYEMPTAQPIHSCYDCGDYIYDGEHYYEIDGCIVCEDCIVNFRKVAEQIEI